MADSSTTTSTTPTGATGAGGGQMIRLTGLSSGLDVDALVKKMLAGEQTKIDSAKSKLQTIQWQQSAYQTIIKDVKSFQSSFFDVSDSSNYILSKNNYTGLDTNISDSTVANIAAQSGATAGSYTLNVGQLASGASVSGTSLNSQADVTGTFNKSDWNGKQITFSSSSTPITLSSSFTDSSNITDVVNDINSKIAANSDLSGKVSASYVNDGTKQYIKFTSNSTVSVTSTNAPELNDAADDNLVGKTITSASAYVKLTTLDSSLNTDLKFNFAYNGTSYSVDLDNSASGKNGSATIADLNSAINAATGGAVTATIDDTTGKFVLKTTNTGSTANLTLNADNVSGKLTSALGLTSAIGVAAQGKDAIFSITNGGNTTTMTKSSNSFTLNSINYSLTSTGTTTATVSTNTDDVYNKIKNFIDKYNSIVSEIQTKLTEKKDYNYYPLTDAKKAAMSSTEITNWETKAQQGILRNDDNLTNLLTSLNDAFTTAVKNAGLSFGTYGPNALGIDTSNDVTNGYQITISDPDKLKAAIANHGDEIYTAFANVSTSTDKDTANSENGIFTRVNNILNDYVGITGTTLNSAILTQYANKQDDYTMYGSAGTGTLPDQVYLQNKVITDLNTEYSDMQEKYYKQFANLESAMTTINAQSSVVSSMFSS